MPSIAELKRQLAELEDTLDPAPDHNGHREPASPRLPPAPPPPPKSAFSSDSSTVKAPTRHGQEGALTRQSSSYSFTMGEVQDQMALSAAYRAVHKDAKTSPDGGVRYAVSRTFAQADDPRVLLLVAARLSSMLLLKAHLFLIIPSNPSPASNPIVLFSSSQAMVDKTVMLLQARFGDRLTDLTTDLAKMRQTGLVGNQTWLGGIEGLDLKDAYDEKALWHILSKATDLTSPHIPPPGSLSIDEVLERERSKLARLLPREAYVESSQGLGAFLVDIRPEAQRSTSGGIPRALVIERNVLEWRFDPRSSARLPIADRYDIRVIVFCEEGYTSSLAAAALQELGLKNATDIIGGFQGWLKQGLPTTRLRLVED